MYKKESSFITALPQFPPALPEIPETGVDSQSGSLSRTYQYDVCLTGGSLSSDFRFLRPLIPVFSMGDPNFSENHRISSGFQETPEQAEGQEQREQWCVSLFTIVLQNPLTIYSIEMQVEDINDNSPAFSQTELNLSIPENAPTNTRFPLESAQDTDLGKNTIQNYTLSPNENFHLEIQSGRSGRKHLELVLEKPLDREKAAQLGLTLTAVDGGVPQRTGTVQININVLDTNDNFPEFAQSEYIVSLKENSPRDTLVLKVEARDLDLGSNAEITYSFHQAPEKISQLFQLHQTTGEITVLGPIDYEKETRYYMNIKATDGGGFSGHCKVLVEIEDENDNAPEISVITITSPLAEDSPLDTLVVLFSVTDRDSRDNGRTSCSVGIQSPFLLKTTLNNYYQLVTQSPLDREKVSEYNVTITATDKGSPKLTTERTITVLISDINDNSPVFEKSKYEMQVWENNIPGLLMGSVRAVDLDVEQNAKVTYSLVPENASGASAASYVSINSETGNLYVLRSLDYEQIKEFQVRVRASDGGSPPLSSEVVVRVVILDENDNAPFFLYPLQNSTSPFNELVPKSVEAGYLVAKVVAVDGDSGQNSWLSYELLKATDPGLFSIGAQNGEVKTRRPLTERDTNKQRLIILVRDNGHPPQTSTATLNILPVDGFSDPYLNVASVSHEAGEEDGSLTMYLVICLAAVSFVFLICIIVFVAIKVHKKESSFITALPQFPPALPEIPETGVDSQSGSLSRTYHYDVCLTGGSLSSDFRYLRPLIPVFSVGDPNVSENHRISSISQETSEQVEGQKEREQKELKVTLMLCDEEKAFDCIEWSLFKNLAEAYALLKLFTSNEVRSVHRSGPSQTWNKKLVTYSRLPGKISDQPVSSYVSINSETGNLCAI
ncbi:PREDICTED: putative protocadherin beta-18 [Gekko japonicus]|uniref:Protocadherin beta-18 n=1 Tax=Gekko japonicus TaxID=146911 RepID=A0ABM1JX92_GEKJA|nr:PREDICTED: putative protocadherin beta-18 [Gekko japonicus]